MAWGAALPAAGLLLGGGMGTSASRPEAASLCVDLPGDPAAGRSIERANRYPIGNFGPVRLPRDLSWREDPLGNRTWAAKLHTLRWTEHLIAAWQDSGDDRYRRRWRTILLDWIVDNPPGGGRSSWAWDNHIAAQRSGVLVCALRFLDAPWLLEAIGSHGEAIARPETYTGVGNHALNENLNLFLIGCAIDRGGWMDLAVDRTAALFADAVDAQGVNYEHSVFYHWYSYWRYGVAMDAFRTCGRMPPAVMTERHGLMTDFLTHATTPSRRMVRIGDTANVPMPSVPGTTLAYASTGGASGPRPDATVAVYAAGYVFGRSGWGDGARSFRDETYYALRFGPARESTTARISHHGHIDETALYLEAHGRALLEDTGFKGYRTGAWRRYVKSPQAHNRLTVDHVPFNRTVGAELIATDIDADAEAFTIRTGAWGDTAVTRRVVYVRDLDALLVQDVARSARPVRVRQQWNFARDLRPVIARARLDTAAPGGNVSMRWLGNDGVFLRVRRAETRPLNGWVAYSRRKRAAAATVQAVAGPARTHDLLTLIVPWTAARPAIDATVLRRGPGGFAVRLRIEGVVRTVRMTAGTVTVV